MRRRRANTHDPNHALNMAVAGIEDATNALVEATDLAEQGDVIESYEKIKDARRYLSASSAHVHYASDAPDFAGLRGDIFRNYEDLAEALFSLEKLVVYPNLGGSPRVANRGKREGVGGARARHANTIALKNRLV